MSGWAGGYIAGALAGISRLWRSPRAPLFSLPPLSLSLALSPHQPLTKRFSHLKINWMATGELHNQPVSLILKASGVSSVSNDAPRQRYVLTCPALVDNLGRREGGEREGRRVENNNKHILMRYKTVL